MEIHIETLKGFVKFLYEVFMVFIPVNQVHEMV